MKHVRLLTQLSQRNNLKCVKRLGVATRIIKREMKRITNNNINKNAQTKALVDIESQLKVHKDH